MIPGEIIISDKELEINSGSEAIEVEVSNTGDRPIQVGSHYHFFETNEALKFSLPVIIFPYALISCIGEIDKP